MGRCRLGLSLLRTLLLVMGEDQRASAPNPLPAQACRSLMSSNRSIAIAIAVPFVSVALMLSDGGSQPADAIPAPVAASDQILFVHVHCESNQVSIVRVDSRPGRLKEGLAMRGGLQIQLADAQGQALWSAAMADPRIRSIEGPAEGTNLLARVNTVVSVADVVIRVPMKSSAREVVLLGEPSPSLLRARSVSDTTVSPQPVRPVLARFKLSAESDSKSVP